MGVAPPDSKLRITPRFTEVHCHCLPGIDDGPANLIESLALCRQLVANGTSTVIATPHQLGPYKMANPATQIRQEVTKLNDALHESRIPLTVLPGGEVRLDERLVELLDQDHILTLGDHRQYLLLELLDIQVDVTHLLRALIERGITPVIAHAELIWWLGKNPKLALSWIPAGVVLQLNAGSLLGRFGAPAQQAAWTMAQASYGVIVASDAHNTGRRAPCLREAYEALAKAFDPTKAQLMCADWPKALAEPPDAK